MFLPSHALICAGSLSFPAPPTSAPLSVRSGSLGPLQSLSAGSSQSRVASRQKGSRKSLRGYALLLPHCTQKSSLPWGFKFYFAAVADWVQKIVFKKGYRPLCLLQNSVMEKNWKQSQCTSVGHCLNKCFHHSKGYLPFTIQTWEIALRKNTDQAVEYFSF